MEVSLLGYSLEELGLCLAKLLSKHASLCDSVMYAGEAEPAYEAG